MKAQTLSQVLGLLVFLTLASSPAQAQTWIQSPVNQHWYTASPSTSSWPEAEALSVAWGGHLATVRSQSENDWIATTFETGNSANAWIWTGYSDTATEGVWVWSSGEVTTFTNWDAGEPNNVNNEDWGTLRILEGSNNFGFWNDEDAQHLWEGLVELESDDCDQNGLPDLYEIATDPSLDCNGNSVLDHCERLAGNYCQTSPNSVGTGALIGYFGTLSIADNTFTVRAGQSPANQFGLFFYGLEQTSVPFGNGVLCVGPGSNVIHRLVPPQLTDDLGNVQRLVDFTQPPASMDLGEITPGSTWNFQFWYRDPAGGGAFFNLSDALSATFCP